MNDLSTRDEQHIKTLVRQTSRWANASQQDESPLIQVLHANYATGYLWALKDLYTDDQISKVMNIDSKKFTKKITTIQDNSTRKLAEICPEYSKGLDSELLMLG